MTDIQQYDQQLDTAMETAYQLFDQVFRQLEVTQPEQAELLKRSWLSILEAEKINQARIAALMAMLNAASGKYQEVATKLAHLEADLEDPTEGSHPLIVKFAHKMAEITDERVKKDVADRLEAEYDEMVSDAEEDAEETIREELAEDLEVGLQRHDLSTYELRGMLDTLTGKNSYRQLTEQEGDLIARLLLRAHRENDAERQDVINEILALFGEDEST